MEALVASLTRRSPFNGIIEGVAAGLLSVVLLFDTSTVRNPFALLFLVATCAVAGAAGRSPYLASLVATAMLAAVALWDIGGPSVASLAAFIVVEAIATTGRWRWIAPIAAVNALVFVLSLVGEPAFLPEVAVAVLGFGVALVLGLLRYRRREENESFDVRRSADLSALRRDIARDLHDSIAHDITTMVLRAGQAKSADLPPAAVEHVDAIVATGQRSLADLRTMLTVLRREAGADQVSMWSPRKPSEELANSRERLRDAGFVVDLQSSGDVDGMPPLVDEVVVKCLVECISNVIKHGERGSTVTVRMEVEDDAELLVLNRVPATARPVPVGGLGLVGIAERVETLGGTVEAGGDSVGRVWSVHLTVPLGERR